MMIVISFWVTCRFNTMTIDCKKKNVFKICYHNIFFFCQINFIIIYLVEITYYFEFLMIKSISFIVLTHFFHFNQLKI